MERSGLDWPGLESIAVGRGPGTFTGLRIGLATARALAEAHALPLRTVSSLAALAAGIDAPLRLALIDARRGEVFGALYAGADERWAPFVARPEAVAERAAELSERPLAAGDGSLRFRDVIETAGIPVAAEESPMHLVRALHVCRLAAQAPPLPAEAALPDYLREPDVTMKPAT